MSTQFNSQSVLQEGGSSFGGGDKGQLERDFCIHVAVCLDESWYSDMDGKMNDEERQNTSEGGHLAGRDGDVEVKGGKTHGGGRGGEGNKNISNTKKGSGADGQQAAQGSDSASRLQNLDSRSLSAASHIVQKGCDAYGVSPASFLAILQSSYKPDSGADIPVELEVKMYVTFD